MRLVGSDDHAVAQLRRRYAERQNASAGGFMARRRTHRSGHNQSPTRVTYRGTWFALCTHGVPAVGAAEQFCAAMAPQPQTQISIPELIRLQLAHDTWLAKFALCALLITTIQGRSFT